MSQQKLMCLPTLNEKKKKRPMALIIPAKTHPDVIVYSIAARDKARATAYAKKHGIPHVRDSYQGE